MRGDLLDLHPAFTARQQRHALLAAVYHHAEIIFPGDLRALFDQQAAHDLTFPAGLMRDQMHTEDLLRCAAHLFQRTRHLHPAPLAAPARMDLRLHHPHRTAQLLRRNYRLIDAETCRPARRRDTELAQNLFTLVFVNFHNGLSFE